MKKSKISRGTDIYHEKAGIINREIEYSLIKKDQRSGRRKVGLFSCDQSKKRVFLYSFGCNTTLIASPDFVKAIPLLISLRGRT